MESGSSIVSDSRVGVMSYMFEVYYRPPADRARESTRTARVEREGGRLQFREDDAESGPICLTYEFDDFELAERVADDLRTRGEHVEGPANYGA
jgi:hypothetical protein